MSKITTDQIKQLREATGARVMDAKKALAEAEGNFEKAKDIVLAKGMARAEKKQNRDTGAGYIASYVHNNNQVAAMVEIACETDFVARNSEFQQMAKDVAMQTVSMSPETVEDLLAQDYIKNPSETVEHMIKAASGKIGEKFVVKRFVRYAVSSS